MLHPINLPDYDQNMEKIASFLKQFITFICDPATPPIPPIDYFQHIFGEEVGIWLFKWLKQEKKEKKEKKEQKSQSSTYYSHLCTILAHFQKKPALRQTILSAFTNDINFLQYLGLNSGTFQFHFNTLIDKNMQSLFKSLLVVFYTDLFQKGFLLDIADFNRKKLLDMFYAENETLQVCPACDGERPSLIDQYKYIEADHFLPKSLYPFLVLHSSNLAPICLQCNQKSKRDRDPLDHSLSEPLLHTFFPFKRHALGEIKVIITREPNGERKLYLEELSGGASKRIEKLDYLFNLTNRWNEQLKLKIGRIEHKIRNTSKKASKTNWGASEIVEDVLEDEIEGARLGIDTYYILGSSYANYALHNDDERITLIELLSKEETTETQARVDEMKEKSHH